jgi:peptidyl-prolyl cis-trans isomerase D
MFNRFIRRYQQPLLIIFTVLIIIAFVGFFDRSGMMGKFGHDAAATIYGRPVTEVQMQREARKFSLAQKLGMQDLLVSLVGRPQSESDAIENFMWNSMVARHEAEELGVSLSDDEVLTGVQALRVFQTGGAFDPKKYEMIVKNALPPMGFDEKQVADLVRDELTLKKLKTLLATTVAPAPAEVRAMYDERYQKTEASVVRFKLDDFLATATVSDEDVQKLYEGRKDQLKSEEKRKVKVAAFVLPTTDKPLEGKERAEQLGKLSKAAEDFAVAMTEKDADFAAAAATAGAKVEDVPEFTRRELPPALGGAQDVVAAAFKVSLKEPVSEIITTERGYYALQLTGISEVRPLTLDEAKPKLVEQLKRERALEALNLKATEIRTKIDTELKAGKSLAEGAAAAGVKAEAFGAFSQAEPKFDGADAGEVMRAAFDMKEGALSPFTPTATGGILVRVDKRLPIDDSKFAAQKDFLADNVSQFARETMFIEWLKNRRTEARVMMPKRG